MLALKPSLFPLPPLCRLLFLQSAFHSGFNSLQALPNGFFTRGPQHARASHQFPEISRAPRTQKGDPFPTLSPLPAGCSSALFCTPATTLSGQRGKPRCARGAGSSGRVRSRGEPGLCGSLINLAVGRQAGWQGAAGVPGRWGAGGTSSPLTTWPCQGGPCPGRGPPSLPGRARAGG